MIVSSLNLNLPNLKIALLHLIIQRMIGITLLDTTIFYCKICGANKFIFQKSTNNQKSIIMIVMKFLVSFLNLNLPNCLKSYLLHLGIQKIKYGITLLSKQFSIYHIKICGANRFIFQKSTKNQKSIIMIVMKFLVSFLNLNLPNRLKSYLLHLVIQNLKRNNFLQWHLLR